MSEWRSDAKPPVPDRDCHREMAEAASEQMRFIMANRERLVEAWVAETGLMPSESVLIEQRMDDGTIRVRIERQQKGLT